MAISRGKFNFNYLDGTIKFIPNAIWKYLWMNLPWQRAACCFLRKKKTWLNFNLFQFRFNEFFLLPSSMIFSPDIFLEGTCHPIAITRGLRNFQFRKVTRGHDNGVIHNCPVDELFDLKVGLVQSGFMVVFFKLPPFLVCHPH